MAPPVIMMAPPPPPPPRSSGAVWKVLTFVFFILLVLSVAAHRLRVTPGVIGRNHPMTDRNRELEEVSLESTNNTENKIAVVDVNGIITSASDRSDMNMVDYIRLEFRAAQRDPNVKAVILRVNSPGGEVLASDEINKVITRFEESSHKPVVASMESLAASGGYYVSVPCRWIVANELTLTGSIGVIMHDYNYRLLMDKVGIRPNVYKSGRFKDMLSGEREPDTDKLSPEDQRTRDEEDRMVQSLIDETYNQFKDVVKTGRETAAKENGNDGKTLVDDWQDYADGRVLSGKQALNFGFVDELGDFETAVKRAKTIANISSASLIAYREPFDLGGVLSHIFGKSDVPALNLKIDLGMDLPKLQAGLPYYIMPTSVLH